MRRWLLRLGLASALAVVGGCGPADQPNNNGNDGNGGSTNQTVLQGKVTQAGGASGAVAGADIRLIVDDGSAAASATEPSARTSDDGTFEIQDPPTRTFSLDVTPPAGSGLQEESIRISAITGVTTQVVVRLLPAGVTVASITIAPTPVTVGEGRSQQFTAQVATSDDSSVRPTWSVTGGIGQVSANGEFTGVSAGDGEVRVTLGGQVASAAVTVAGCVLEVRDEQDQNPSGQQCNTATFAREIAVDGRAPLIVAYHDRERCAALLESLGARIDRELPLIGALVVEAPTDIIPLLEASDAVRYVDVNASVQVRDRGSIRQTPAEELLPWGVDAVDAERVWGGAEDATTLKEGAFTGKGVKVGIVDTGIDTSHVDLVVAGGKNILNAQAEPTDDNGHGTRVAGIIGARANGLGVIGIAPECDLYAVKVLDMRGGGTIADVVAGIEWCAANKMNVINMSLGVVTCEQSLKEACDAAYADGQGAVIFGAAGNRGQDTWTAWPGNFASVVSVAGTDQSDLVASFSVHGAAVEVAAPGEQIFTTDLDNGYAVEDGTSFSAPHAAGVAALVWSTGRYSSAERVRQHMRDTAKDLGPAGRDQESGYGLVDAYTAATDRSCSDQ